MKFYHSDIMDNMTDNEASDFAIGALMFIFIVAVVAALVAIIIWGLK